MATKLRTLGAYTVLLGVSLSLLLAQAPNNAGAGDRGKGKGKAGPPGANHPERLQVLILTGQNPRLARHHAILTEGAGRHGKV
jgi:hypothetical protein